MLQKKYAFALLGGMLLLPMASAQAQELALKPYLGVGLGAFGLEYSEPGFNQKNTVFGGFAKGGIDINDYVGVELRLGTTAKGSSSYGAGFLGAPTAFTVDLKSDYFLSYLVKLQYPTTPDLRLYAMLGGTTAKAKVTVTAPGVLTAGASKTKTGFSYGFGGDYNINDQLSAGAEWMQYWTDVTLATNVKAKMWGAVASLTYHF